MSPVDPPWQPTRVIPIPAATGDLRAGLFTATWWTRALTEAERQPAVATTRPDWVDAAERAAGEACGTDEVPREWAAAFGVVLRPFTTGPRERVVAAVPARHADPEEIGRQFVDALDASLVRLAARTLVLELNRRRVAGHLRGADGRERFVDFVRGLADPAALAGLLGAYPVLARLLVQAGRSAADAHVELLTRFAADRPAIVARLLDGLDPGPLLALEQGHGDTHSGGRSVTVLRFADDHRVVYKPRSLDGQVQLNAWIDRLDRALPGLGLEPVAVLSRAGYGWMRFVTAAPVPDLDGVERFYRRAGALLALLRVARVTDIHYGNVLACGDQPALVDAETVLQPIAPEPGIGDPAVRAMRDSVCRTNLLPDLVPAAYGMLDVSGLGGDSRIPEPVEAAYWQSAGTDGMRLARRRVGMPTAGNRPRLDGRLAEPADHAEALVTGFRRGYDALVRHRGEFAAMFDAAADCTVRVVVRPTQAYVSVLDESTHPDLLRDAVDRDAFLRRSLADSGPGPLAQRLTEYEIRDLWAGDVPCFAGRAGSRDLWTSDGVRLIGMVDRDGVAAAVEALTGLSGPDRADQEWIIVASLATRRPPLDPPVAVSTSTPARDAGPGPDQSVDADRMLTAACAIADQLLARSMTGHGRLNWLGLELVDETQWLVLPMGAALGTGYTGVALFLAELAALTGVARYHGAARAAMRAVSELADQLRGQPAWLDAIGCGGYDGLAGIAYGLARLSNLLDEPRWRADAEAMVELAAAAFDPDGPPGVAKGAAGCLAAMLAVHRELGLDGAARLAGRCADHLVELVERTDGWGADETPTGSFAGGAAGIGWALARYADGTPQPRALRAAALALRRAAPLGTDPAAGWSTGLAGLLAARATSRTGNSSEATENSSGFALEAAVSRLAGSPVSFDLSLASGEFGVLEALAAASPRSPLALRARHHRCAPVVEAICREEFGCGVPDGVLTPGLLTGLAGLGHGLLRLGFPDRVPSVLLLESGRNPT